MTHGVVQSDIELAKKLVEAGCHDAAICATLCWRGVDAIKAAGLVQDLRQGKLTQPQLPLVPGQLRRHRHLRHSSPKKSATRRSATVAATSPVSREPLFIHYDHRPRWRRITNRFFRWGATGLICCGVLLCFAYVGVNAYFGATKSAEEMDNWAPDWRARYYRWNNDIPAPACDDLKAKPPISVSSEK